MLNNKLVVFEENFAIVLRLEAFVEKVSLQICYGTHKCIYLTIWGLAIYAPLVAN